MITWNKELYHYGMPRRSGRYKWGSGEDPYHHGASDPSRRTKRLQKKTSQLKLYAGMNRQAANNEKNPLRSINKINEKYYSKRAAKYENKLAKSKEKDSAKNNKTNAKIEQIRLKTAKKAANEKIKEEYKEKNRPYKEQEKRAYNNYVQRERLINLGSSIFGDPFSGIASTAHFNNASGLYKDTRDSAKAIKNNKIARKKKQLKTNIKYDTLLYGENSRQVRKGKMKLAKYM